MLRYERKYLVSNSAMNDLRKKIIPFVKPDIYAEKENGLTQYTVRSIYYDSPVFHSYYEKIEGLKDRKKLRIRGYDHFAPDNLVFLEIKRKLENRIAKNRSRIAFNSLPEFLETGNLSLLKCDPDNTREIEDASRFMFNMKRYCQQPANLVVYEREPYHGKFDHGVRITLDKNIRSSLNPRLDQLYEDPGLKYLWEQHFILEIKYFTDNMPSWARAIIDHFGLRHEALSKYAMGLDKHPLAQMG
jgi:hypothetical protein